MSMRSIGIGLVAAAAICLGPGRANADAVPPPPEECPAGTRGATDHYGPHCAPADCQTDADCPKEHACRPYALCVFERVFESPRGNTHRREAKGACERGQACPLDSPCQAARYCMPGAPASAAPSSSPTDGPSTADATSSPTPAERAAGSPPSSGSCGKGSCSLDDRGAGVGAAALVVALVAAGGLARRRSRRGR